jgi:transcriptional regulator with PAS, ATPase and Fis domain
MEAKRGLLRSARSHVRLGQQMLSRAPNLWIDAMLEITSANIAVMRSDYESALRSGRRAIELARRSGGAASQRTCLANLGFIAYSTGEFDNAVSYFQRAIAVLPSSGESHSGMLETLARIRLTQGRTNEAKALIDQLEDSITGPRDRVLYTYRHTLLTRAQFYARESRIQDALEQVDRAMALANEAGDDWLSNRAQLKKAQLLQQDGRARDALRLLEPLVTILISQSDLHAEYEVILTCALVSAGKSELALAHRMRAERLYASLRHAPGLLELSRCWDAAILAANASGAATASSAADTPQPEVNRVGSVLQAVAALMVQAGRPEFVAHELLELLAQSGCVRRAVAQIVDADGKPGILATIGDAATATRTPDARHRRFTVGSVGDRSIEMWIEPNDDIESTATINAVTLLLSTIHEIERARAEREQRLTLWPIDDAAVEDGQAVVGGRMRELMTYAKRIATTNVGVLITGESGTGKEVLARAIHNYSDAADKPFIPFNCAAIPREMLESQLFGHRRGAFTSADRDNPGVIRAARGGTLFLDEIGELSIDLQPKLLRFLESGEICPLGDTTPFIVNVRVIAATNSNLEQAVKDGRFREDLFYRLNIVRLQIPPLRERRDEIPALVHHFITAAATEYRKGHVRIAEEAMEQLLLFSWPGNIRQLHNELRRLVALAEPGAILTPEVLSAEIANAKPAAAAQPQATLAAPFGEKLRPALERVELEMIKVALRDHNGRVDAAAKALGISRKGLYLKRQRLGL